MDQTNGNLYIPKEDFLFCIMHRVPASRFSYFFSNQYYNASLIIKIKSLAELPLSLLRWRGPNSGFGKHHHTTHRQLSLTYHPEVGANDIAATKSVTFDFFHMYANRNNFSVHAHI